MHHLNTLFIIGTPQKAAFENRRMPQDRAGGGFGRIGANSHRTQRPTHRTPNQTTATTACTSFSQTFLYSPSAENPSGTCAMAAERRCEGGGGTADHSSGAYLFVQRHHFSVCSADGVVETRGRLLGLFRLLFPKQSVHCGLIELRSPSRSGGFLFSSLRGKGLMSSLRMLGLQHPLGVNFPDDGRRPPR